MPRAVAYDGHLVIRCDQLRADLDADSTLHLFNNNFLPLPSSLHTDFGDASFPGYAPVSMTGHWGLPYFPHTGKRQFNSDTITFTNTGGDQLIYGWWLSGGPDWWFARRFDTPIVVSIENPLALIIKPFVASRSIFPCDEA